MKILCPKHADTTPSMHVYNTHGYCFVCKALIPIDRLELDEELKVTKKEPENVLDTYRYIRNCEIRNIRGLQLHADDEGYYITWPSMAFYKKRLFRGDLRYLGPRGVRAPLLTYQTRESSTLVLVEGELNLFSLSACYSDPKVVLASPGSANELMRHLSIYLTYKTIYIIVDKDAAGVLNGLDLKTELLKHKKIVHLVALERDFNDILQSDGINGIKEVCKKEGINLDL